jgi:hypothetical protein
MTSATCCPQSAHDGAEIGATGMIKFFDPFPYSFTYGQSEDEVSLLPFFLCADECSH